MDSSVPKKTSGLAVTSLVLGIFSLLLCCCGLLGVPAVVVGHLAHRQVRSSGGTLAGGGLALAGLIMGYLSLVVTLLLVAGLAPQWKGISGVIKTAVPAAQIRAGAVQTKLWPADAGLTTAPAYLAALVEKKGLTEQQAASVSLRDIQIGNVAAADPDDTALVRSKAGVLPSGGVFVMLKDGNIEFYPTEAEAKEAAPPREPPFLAD